MTANGSGLLNNRRLYISDKVNKLSFLVDTGADISVLPLSVGKIPYSSSPCALQLFAANGSRIKTFGQKTLNVDFDLGRVFRWSFVVAKVSKPIIGADFLSNFNLLVDIKHKCLIDSFNSINQRALS